MKLALFFASVQFFFTLASTCCDGFMKITLSAPKIEIFPSADKYYQNDNILIKWGDAKKASTYRAIVEKPNSIIPIDATSNSSYDRKDKEMKLTLDQIGTYKIKVAAVGSTAVGEWSEKKIIVKSRDKNNPSGDNSDKGSASTKRPQEGASGKSPPSEAGGSNTGGDSNGAGDGAIDEPKAPTIEIKPTEKEEYEVNERVAIFINGGKYGGPYRLVIEEPNSNILPAALSDPNKDTESGKKVVILKLQGVYKVRAAFVGPDGKPGKWGERDIVVAKAGGT